MRNFLLALILLFGTQVNAQYILNEYDINTAGSSYPKELTIMNGKLYFVATNLANGQELFYTNGVHPNFTLVSDIMAGPLGSSVANLTVLNGSRLIFSADGGGGKGIELWQSDGTNTGTSLVKDIYAGGVSSTPESFVAFNGKVFFSAYGSAGGNQDFWVTDGTNTGTYLFKDINPTGGSYPKGYCEVGGKLYFEAFTDLEGDEIWVSDGTDTGTRMLKDVKAGMLGSYPQNLFGVGNKLLFTVSVPPPAGSVVYESDGTTVGTKVFNKPGFNNINRNFIISWKNKIYVHAGFTMSDALWYTDGTLAGTDSFKRVDHAGWPVVYNDKLYFSGSASSSTGSELMVSDGTKAGTKLLKDIIPGPDASAPSYLTVYRNKIYFIAQSSLGDTQLYVSDGTDTGTHKIVNTLATQTNPLSVTAFNGFKEYDGKLYFAANYTGNGAELWSLEDTSKPVGITQILHTQNIALYPNPAKAVCNVIIDNTVYQKGSILLCDMKGSVLLQQQLSAGQKHATIQLANIATGVYTIKVDVDGNIVNRKLVVQ